jgi:predicted aspartyl protease
VYTHKYDTNYDSPALPVVEIQVSALIENGVVLTRRALVDSGADATIIPLRDLEKMSARKIDTRRLRVIGGVSYRVDIYEVTLAFGPYRVPKIFAVADRQNREVILGRDVLNQFTTTLDGLAYMVHISQ